MHSTNEKKRHFSVKEKLNVLKLVSEGWSVTDACIYFGVRRSNYYKWKKLFENDGERGLSGRKNIFKKHASSIKVDVENHVIDLSIARAEDGCCKIAEALSGRGINITSPTVQKILIRAGLGKKNERLYTLERHHVVHQQPITSKQDKLISKLNPAFKHRAQVGAYPGEVLVQHAFPIFDYLPGHYVLVIIDTYSFYGFSLATRDNTAKMAIDLLNRKALKFFDGHKLTVKKVMTSRGREFTQFNNQYALFLSSQNISHHVDSGKAKNWNGFIEKYKKETIKKLKQMDLSPDNLNQIIRELTNEKKHGATKVDGFPTFGDSPAAIIERYKSTAILK